MMKIIFHVDELTKYEQLLSSPKYRLSNRSSCKQ